MTQKTGGIPKEVTIERERRAWELRQKFYTHERIALDLGVERSTITKMLQRVSAKVNAKLYEEVGEEKRAQIEQLHFVADEAAQAWQRSKAARRDVTKKTGAAGTFRKAAEETTVHSADQDGDPRYLTTALGALSDIRKILGFEARQAVDVTSGGEKINPYMTASAAELRQIAKRILDASDTPDA